MANHSIVDRLRAEIKRHFESLVESANPYFSELVKTSDGYRQAEEMIIEYCIKNQVSIGSAIALIESSFV